MYIIPNKSVLRVVICLALFCLPTQLYVDQAVAQSNSAYSGLDLTSAEQAWLTAHPQISIGVMDAWPPIDFVDAHGRIQGISVDYIAAFNEWLDGALKIEAAPFKENYDKVINGELDAIMDISQRHDREELFCFTQPYIAIPHVIVGRIGEAYCKTEQDLAGKTLALEQGYHNVIYFKENFPGVRVNEYESTADALHAVANGSADAYAGNRAVATYLIEHELMTGLQFMGKLREPASILQIGTRKDNPELAGILDKALAKLSFGEHRAIRLKWFELSTNQRGKLDLNAEEQAWLDSHPTIRIAPDPNFPPLEFFDEAGNYQGFVADNMHLIEEKLGVTFEVIRCESWIAVLDALREGKADIVGANVADEISKRDFLFTRPYFSFPNAILSHQKITREVHLEDLSGIQVVSVAGWPETNLLRMEYPEIQVVEVPSVEEGLTKIATGENDYMLAYLPTASYFIQHRALQGLRVAGYLPDSVEDAIMVRKELPTLRNILQKALDSISEEERTELRIKWFPTIVEEAPVQRIPLTKDEQEWLDQHPVIRLGVDSKFFPFEFLDDQGKHKGITAEYMKLLSQRIGFEVEVVQGLLWSEVISKAKSKDLDVLPGVFPTEQRKEFLTFTDSFVKSPSMVFCRKRDDYIKSIDDLYGKSVSVIEAGYMQDLLLAEYPDINLVTYPTVAEAMVALSMGKDDAYIGALAEGTYIIEKHSLSNLTITAPFGDDVRYMCMGVRDDWPELTSILNKGLATITIEEKLAIQHKWVGVESRLPLEEERIELTADEQKWLDQHPVIRLGINNAFHPFEFLDKRGVHSGIAADHIRMLGNRLGFGVEIVEDQLWSEVISKARKKELDVLPALFPNEERKEFLNFTEPYAESTIMIFCRRTADFIGNADDLVGMSIAIIDSGYIHNKLLTEYSHLDVNPYPTAAEAMFSVSIGKEDVYIGALAGGSYIIEKNNLSNLKIAAPFDSKVRYLSMGVRNDWPELTGILNKGLRSISLDEAKSIRQRWVSVRYEHGVDLKQVGRWGVLGASIALLIIALIWFWNRDLQRVIKLRHLVEADLVVARERAESADHLKSAFLATMSHELRTPLNSIIGFTGILLQGLPGKLNAEQNTQMKLVQTSSRQLLSLINDILDISKIEAGQLKLVYKPFNLRESIQDIVTSMKPLAAEKHLKLLLTVADNIGEINSDQQRVEQVVLNLISNSIKFTDQGEIHVAIRDSDKSNGGEMYFVSVSDPGMGIKAEDMGKLFNKFQQLDTGLTRAKAGTGLGLSICKKLVELLGGKITVKSQFGVGSVFRFTLPVNNQIEVKNNA